jgi:hypothetical protein
VSQPKRCQVCDTIIPLARLDAVPDTVYCVKCAAKYGPKPKVGFMVSTASKGTASTLVTVDPDDEEALRRAQRAHRRER